MSLITHSRSKLSTIIRNLTLSQSRKSFKQLWANLVKISCVTTKRVWISNTVFKREHPNQSKEYNLQPLPYKLRENQAKRSFCQKLTKIEKSIWSLLIICLYPKNLIAISNYKGDFSWKGKCKLVFQKWKVLWTWKKVPKKFQINRITANKWELVKGSPQ